MDDRTLMELAARAAGIHTHHWFEDHAVFMCSTTEGGDPDYGWNPLLCDRDALLLAVKLRLEVYTPQADDQRAFAVDGDRCAHWAIVEVDNGDPYAATRRAIVRAAAAIGQQQP